MMRLELRAFFAAAAAGVVVVAAAFGVSAIVAHSSHTAHFQSMHASMSASNNQMNASMNAASKKMAATMNSGGQATFTQAQLVQGQSFFAANCASCHGANAVGGFGPSLHSDTYTNAQILHILKHGMTGGMPAFGNRSTSAQRQTLLAYIRSLH